MQFFYEDDTNAVIQRSKKNKKTNEQKDGKTSKYFRMKFMKKNVIDWYDN